MKTAFQAATLFVVFSVPCVTLAWGWSSTPPVVKASLAKSAAAH